MSNYIINNDTVDVLSENCITILKNLPAKIYTINAGPQGQMFLKEHNFIFNNRKIYGDLNNKVQRIFKTYESRDKNLGVLLSGLKGTGKSLLIKLCIERAIEDNIPVILVNQKINLNKFSDFIKRLTKKLFVFLMNLINSAMKIQMIAKWIQEKKTNLDCSVFWTG